MRNNTVSKLYQLPDVNQRLPNIISLHCGIAEQILLTLSTYKLYLWLVIFVPQTSLVTTAYAILKTG